MEDGGEQSAGFEGNQRLWIDALGVGWCCCKGGAGLDDFSRRAQRGAAPSERKGWSSAAKRAAALLLSV